MAVTAAPPRVLVVEDDPTVAEVVVRYLVREGYRVEAVADGAWPCNRPWPTRPSWWCST